MENVYILGGVLGSLVVVGLWARLSLARGERDAKKHRNDSASAAD